MKSALNGGRDGRTILAKVREHLDVVDVLGVPWLSQYGAVIFDDLRQTITKTSPESLPTADWNSFRLTPQGHVVLRAKVNGRSFDLLLDNCCLPAAFVKNGFASTCRATKESVEEFLVGYGPFTSKEYATEIAVGPLVGPAGVVTFPAEMEATVLENFKVDGLIGGFIFAGRRVAINWVAKKWAVLPEQI